MKNYENIIIELIQSKIGTHCKESIINNKLIKENMPINYYENISRILNNKQILPIKENKLIKFLKDN